MKNYLLISVVMFALIHSRPGYCESVTLSFGDRALAIQYPVSLEDAVIYRDGGTIGLDLKDVIGNHLLLSMDARLSTQTASHDLYIGVLHPTAEGAIRVQRASELEKRIFALLSDWKNWQSPQQLEDPKAALVLRVIEILQERNK